MTVTRLVDILDARIANLADGDREVVTCYCGDFLSNVMGKAPADSAWFTVMNNVNVCAVASLTDVSVVVLCEGAQPDEALTARAAEQDINLILTDRDVFSAAVAAVGEL